MTPLIEARRITVRRGHRAVLCELSLSLEPGTLLALVGPNGAGKSTAIETLAGVLTPVSGEVRVRGVPLAQLSRRARAREVALIGQEVHGGLSLPVRTVVELGRLAHRAGWGLSTDDRRTVERALCEFDCYAIADRPLFSLSGGQRQRVHWARASCQEPHILLLDEATAHLDLAHRERSFAHARGFARKGGAVVAVAHDLDLAVRYATEVLVLDKGCQVASGAPCDVLDSALLRGVFQVDAEVQKHARGISLRVYGARP